jgi:cell volume regulation protein A
MESIATANAILLFGSVLVLLGILSSLVAQRFGAPLLLVFLVIGMFAGEDGPGGIAFNDYQLTYVIGSLALAVILFDGGLRTKLGHLRGAVRPALLLATVGVVVTAALTGVVASRILEIPLLHGFLLGTVIASTDAAAVFFLIHAGGLQIRRRIGATIEMESATNDPVAVFLTIVLVQIISLQQAGLDIEPLALLGTPVSHAVIGAVIGLVGGLAASISLNRINLPGGLHPLLVIAVAVVIYALTSVLSGSGFLAVYLAGLVLGNRPLRASASIVTVNDAATWLSQIVMFLVLGLLITPTRLLTYALPAAAVAAFLLFVARPAAVWLCLSGCGFSVREKLFASWVGLRGAVSIFLAAIPMLADVEHADVFFNVAFVIVLISLLLQGWTLTWTARKLGLALPRTSASVHRSELDLPGQLALEMVGYPVSAQSAVMNGAVVPKWARTAFVIRNQNILMARDAGALQARDYAYFLAPPDRVGRLDQLFTAHAELLSANEPFFGEFAFTGDVHLKDVAAFYGLSVGPEIANLSIADFFSLRFEGKPDVGDHLHLGTAEIVAREVEDDRVVRAGLQLDVLTDTHERDLLPSGLGAVIRRLLMRRKRPPRA